MVQPSTWRSGVEPDVPRVLVVDDDPALRELLENVLMSEGFQVLQADSALGITDLVRDTQPDLILLDQFMQPVSGLDTLQAMRSSGEQVPVVMLTGASREDLLEMALELGADDYVAKPFSEAVLVAHVKAILRRLQWQSDSDEQRHTARTVQGRHPSNEADGGMQVEGVRDVIPVRRLW
jgi:DNA-binding response OmpR family regulator